jgi:hypothetical protein
MGKITLYLFYLDVDGFLITCDSTKIHFVIKDYNLISLQDKLLIN